MDATTNENPLGLISRKGAAQTVGLTIGAFTRLVEEGAAPQPVARLGSAEVWLIDDIEKFRHGTVAERAAFELQAQVLTGVEVARRLGVKVATIATYVHQEHWQCAPRPSGHVGRYRYWLTTEVQSWIAERRTRSA